MRKNQRGQSLIEAIVAVTVIIVGMTGLFSLTNQALGLSRVVSERYVATFLAAEGIELVKNIIDMNIFRKNDNPAIPWNDELDPGIYELDFVDLEAINPTLTPFTGEFLVYGVPLPVAGPPPQPKYYLRAINARNSDEIPTKFVRRIEIEWPDAAGLNRAMIVKAFVNWETRGGAQEEVHLEAHYFDYISS